MVSGAFRCWLVMLSTCLALLVVTACGGSSPAGPATLENVNQAPDFTAPDERGTQRSLAEFRGRTLVLYFYPKDGTPGCTREACAFRDAWQRLAATGAAVVGVSVDSVESHAQFKQKHALPFPLLSDPDGHILDAYGVPKSPQGYAARTTFVIDAQGMIRRIFPEVDPAVHVDELLPLLARLGREDMDSRKATKSPPPPAEAPHPAASASAAATPPPAAGEAAPAPTAPRRAWVIFLEPVRAEMVSAPTPTERDKVSQHFEYLKRLKQEGMLLLAGPSLEPPHVGLVILRAVDRPQAERILAGDPAVAAGVFRARLQEMKLSLVGDLK
ncbi:MAG: redoxin domain-containing protein [Polyangiaceae bacterium]